MLKQYAQKAKGKEPPFDPENDPHLGTEDSFSVWGPEVERAATYLNEHPDFVVQDEAVWRMVELLERRGEYTQAIAIGQHYLANGHKDIFSANLSARVGWIYLKRLHDIKRAKAQFEKFLWFGNGSNMLGYAECLEKSSRWDEAEKGYLRDDRRYGDSDRHVPLSAFYIRQGSQEKALAALGDGSDVAGPKQRRTFFWFAMGFYVDESYPTLVQMLYEKIVPDQNGWISYDYSHLIIFFVLWKAIVTPLKVELRRLTGKEGFRDIVSRYRAMRKERWRFILKIDRQNSISQ